MDRRPELALALRRLAAPETAVALAGVVGALSLWAAHDGGYEEIVWYPAGLLLLVLLCVLWWASGQRRLGPWSASALAGLGGYTVWSYLSILWAADRGLALTGANRALVYTLVLAVTTLRRWRGADALALGSAWAVVVLATGVISLLQAGDGGTLSSFFVDGRLSAPVRYANANAALFVLASWPLLAVFSSRSVSRLARAAALGGATVAAELALLCQSKGAALGAAATIVVIAVAVRERARFLFSVLIVGAVIGLLHRPLLAVYDRLSANDDPRRAIHSALVAVAVSFVVAVAAGAVAAVVDDVLQRSAPERAKTLGRGFLAVAAIGAAALVVGVAIHFGGPAGTARGAWRALTQQVGSDTKSHFVSTAGNHRYDFWRVAAHQFKRSPLLGAGIDNFGADYLRLRKSDEQPLYPHSLEARLLGETGAIGFALFALFALAAVRLSFRASRSGTLLAPVGMASLAMFVYWLAHGSVDWLWEFPALTGSVLAMIGCAASAEPEPEPKGESATNAASPLRANLRRTAQIAGVIASAVVLVPSWLAARDVATALSSWHHHPAVANSLLSSAARLNPLSDEAYTVAGTIAERRRDWPGVQRDFQDALKRSEQNWYSHLELGIALAKEGQKAAALSTLRRAQTLDPREPLIDDVLADVRKRRPIDVSQIDQLFISRTTAASAAA